MKRNYTILGLLFLCSINAAAQVEFEPNNTILQNSNSNTFTAPQTIGANITTSTPDDKDFFKIILPYPATWSFNIINPNGTPCVLKMYLYNAQNTANVIIRSSGTTFDFDAGIPNPVALNCSGTVYVQIDQTSGTNLGAYSLQVTENSFSGFVTNNDTTVAALIPVDTTIQGKLYGYDCGGNVDMDWYKVIAPRCGVLNINVTGVNKLQEIKIDCYDSTKTLIAAADNVAGGANNSIGVLLSSGVSYIRISDRSGFNCGNQCTDPYDLVDDPFNVTLAFDTTDLCECNKRIEEACSIPINTSFDSKLWGINYLISDNSALANMDLNGDQDWYKVIAPKCGVLNINVTGVNSFQEIKIDCYDSNKALIAAAPNVGGGVSNSISVLLSPGVSYIRISDRYGFNCGNQCTDPYDLVDDPFTVSLAFDTTDVCECNNRIEEACSIPINTSFDSKLWGIKYLISNNSSLQNVDLDGDQDWYKVIAPDCGVLNINVTGVNAIQEIKIEYFDSTKTIIGTSPNATGGTNVNYNVFLPIGTSYIRISDRYRFNCGNQCTDPYDLVDDPFTTTLSFSPLGFNGLPATTVTSHTYCFDGTWKNFYDTINTSKLLASIKENNQTLGTTGITDYIDNTAGITNSDWYMRRHYVIKSNIAPSTAIKIRLYYSNSDFSDLQAVVPTLTSASQLVVTQYHGLNEDGTYNPSSGSTTFISSSAINTGVMFGQNYLEFDVTELGEFWIHTGNFVLPLHFTSFTAAKKNNQVELSWSTVNEVGVNYFNIERSVNGSEFFSIASKRANNQSSNRYTLIDLSTIGYKSLYYRIKEVDYNGLYRYSTIAKINFDKPIDVLISPNPVKELVTIVASNIKSLQLLNLNGQVIKNWKPNANQRYNVSEVPNGLYILKLMNNETTQTEKILIQR